MPRKGAKGPNESPQPAAPVLGHRPPPSEPTTARRSIPAELRDSALLAVDPGDVHVGLAEFIETADEWECIAAYELGWTEALDRVALLLGGGYIQTLVVESFRLYADEAKAQIGSEMQTAQCIGAIRYLVSLQHRRADRIGTDRVELAMQPASIQKATTAICKAKGVEFESHGNPHARSAELHGWHNVLRRFDGESAWLADSST